MRWIVGNRMDGGWEWEVVVAGGEVGFMALRASAPRS